MSLKMFARLLAFPITACAGQIFWMANYSPDNTVASLIWIPLLTYCWFCIGGLSHEIVHDNLSISKTLSVLIARIIGTVLGIPYTVYREIHMRHHAYLNTPLDWEMWPYGDPQASLRFRRVFVWFDILFAVIATPVIWGRICYASNSPVAAEVRRTMRREYLAVFLFWTSVVGTCVWVHQTGRFEFRPEHLVFALPPILATIGNGFRKMMDHVGTSSYDPLHGTRTIAGQNFITKAISFFNFDLAIHGPHHRYPKLKHSQLMERMEEITATHPDESYPVYPSFFAAFIDTIRTIIKNPGVGLNTGCKDDLNHLPLDRREKSAAAKSPVGQEA